MRMTPSSNRVLYFIVVLIVLVFGGGGLRAPAMAQDVVTGAFEGSVVDRVTRSPIAGALVTITSEHTGIKLLTRTNTKGRFYEGLLAPGDYRLNFSAEGYISREVHLQLYIGRTNEVVPFPLELEREESVEPMIRDGGGIAVASLPNAIVQVQALDGGLTFKRAIPAEDLVCVFDGLQPKTYLVTAKLEGYKTVEKQVTVIPYKTQPVTLKLLPTEASEEIRKRAGSYYALIIGNNKYPNLRSLITAEADARAVEKILKDQYGFQTKLLLNANRQQILGAVNEYRRLLTDNCNLLIYYAGHGYRDTLVQRAYWQPVDAAAEDNTNWISANEISDNLKGIRARHILIVSDSCYSGTMVRGTEVVNETSLAMTERDAYILKVTESKSRNLMSSGGNEPVSDGGGDGHSIFAEAFLKGLTRMDREIFLGRNLYDNFIAQSVGGRSEQTPEYNPLRDSGHESGDFIFIRRK